MVSTLTGCREQLGGGDTEVWEKSPGKYWKESASHRVNQSREVKAEGSACEDISLGC